MHIPVQKTMTGPSGTAQLPGYLITHFICKFHFQSVKLCHTNRNADLIPKTNRLFILTIHKGNGNDHAPLLQPPVGKADLVHPLKPCLLKIADIIGMMHDSHLIRLVIIYRTTIFFHTVPLISYFDRINLYGYHMMRAAKFCMLSSSQVYSFLYYKGFPCRVNEKGNGDYL